MLSEGRREGLRLALNRSLSEPGEASAAATARCPVSLPQLMAPQVVSMPASPCGDSSTIQRSLLLRRARALEPADVARKLTKTKPKNFLLLDLRTFINYNMRHVRSAINLNCSDRFNRKRLQLRRASVVDLAASPSGRDLLKKRCYKEIIVYDECSTDLEALPPQHPVYLVLTALLEDNREPLLLKGGFQAFERAYPELCEDALMRTRDEVESTNPCYGDPFNPTTPSGVCMGGGIPPSPGNEATIEQAQASEVLPFLYIGNARDAQDLRVLQALGITRVLNVTSHVPGYHENSGICYKTLPAMDSGHQNLRQYFDEAIHFIDEARQAGARVLVHCQAGVSRSPTIVIAYLMKHTRMTMVDSYKYVKSRRLIISPNLNFMGQLVEWETALQDNKTEADCKPCHQCQWQRQEVKKVPSACQV
ncbi:dual specificity protein phosphatase 10-like [Homarus americanus]|uniref:dual specificity protein phosphatase 10-like n=1 Tax=Homarus americanus TaxID=6706 RepID=UPI001C445880|nr:dual specificity protein phosphatase 10-like [Homarus americanus]